MSKGAKNPQRRGGSTVRLWKGNGPPTPAVQLDPDTGLPPVGAGVPRDPAKVIAQARRKHTHRQGHR